MFFAPLFVEAYGPHALLLLQEPQLEDLLRILVKQIEGHRIQLEQGEGALGQLMRSSSQRPSQENLGLVGQGVLGLEGIFFLVVHFWCY